jgi:hypothetical protein
MALGWRELHEGFVIELDVQEIIAENDRVTVRYTERGRFAVRFVVTRPAARPAKSSPWNGSS